MGRDVSIAVSAKDNFSDAITKMRNAGIHFNKNIEEMQAQLKALNSNRATLKLDTDAARKNLQGLQKQIADTRKTSKDGVVSEELLKKLDEANEEYERMRQNLSLLDKSAKETEKSLSSASGVFSKLDNRAGAGGAKNSILSAFAASGLADMAKDLGGSFANAYISSAFGSEKGTMFSSALSGAASGAAIGSMIPVIGTVAGAAIGAGVGTLKGAVEVKGQKDEAFKNYRGEQISAQQERMAADLEMGTSIAAQRELDKIAFDKILKGDSTGTLEAVKTMANTTPFLYEDLKGITKTLATYGTTDPEAIKKRLTQIGDTGAALGMSSADMSMVAAGLGRMQSSGKTTLEYLNLLIERGIPAVDYLAEAMGASNTEVYNMVSKGLIPGAEAAEIIANAMGEANSGAMAEMAETYSGITSTVQGLEQERQNARGEGYIEERSKGMQDQTEYLQNNKKEIGETERLIGQWEASLDNERDAIRREKEAEAYERIKRDGLTGAEAGRVLAEARIAAEAEYNATDGAQLKLESELLLTENVTSMLAENPRFWDANYRLGIEASKGIASGIQKGLTTEELYGVPFSYESAVSGDYGAGNAYGLSYVPYDNYPARLHEGERVLTAAEARAYNTGGGGAVVQKLADTIVVREDADIDRIASELARKLREMQMVS